MRDDIAETIAKKAQREPAAPTSGQIGCEVSGTVTALLGGGGGVAPLQNISAEVKPVSVVCGSITTLFECVCVCV